MESRLVAPRQGVPCRPTARPASGNSAFTSIAGIAPSVLSKGTVPLQDASSLPNAAGPSQPKCARKDRGPNWVPQEVLALIEAKRDMYVEELDAVDGRELMTPESTRWQRISQPVMAAGFSPCLRDGASCKTKWNQLVPDYKKLADYSSRTGRDISDYWDLTSFQRKAEGLPRQFAKEIYLAIHEWFGSKPQIQPPHIWDLLSPSDGNFHNSAVGQHQCTEEAESEPDPEDLMEASRHDTVDSTTGSFAHRSTFPLSSSSPPRGKPPLPGFGGTPCRSYLGVPAGVVPHVLSSSENTAAAGVQRRPSNTVVRRKILSGHSIIAEATKSTGAAMASQMKGITDASLEVEKSKMDIQLQLFKEQMAYQRERDRRLQETAATANENAKLAILKQGEMVNCLSQLTSVLGRGLTTASIDTLHARENQNRQRFSTADLNKLEATNIGSPPCTGSPSSAAYAKEQTKKTAANINKQDTYKQE